METLDAIPSRSVDHPESLSSRAIQQRRRFSFGEGFLEEQVEILALPVKPLLQLYRQIPDVSLSRICLRVSNRKLSASTFLPCPFALPRENSCHTFSSCLSSVTSLGSNARFRRLSTCIRVLCRASSTHVHGVAVWTGHAMTWYICSENVAKNEIDMLSPCEVQQRICPVFKAVVRKGDVLFLAPGSWSFAFAHGFLICERAAVCLKPWLQKSLSVNDTSPALQCSIVLLAARGITIRDEKKSRRDPKHVLLQESPSVHL